MTECKQKRTFTSSDIPETVIVCPFIEHQGKRIGDILLVLMFIVVPFSLLIYFVSILI